MYKEVDIIQRTEQKLEERQANTIFCSGPGYLRHNLNFLRIQPMIINDMFTEQVNGTV